MGIFDASTVGGTAACHKEARMIIEELQRYGIAHTEEKTVIDGIDLDIIEKSIKFNWHGIFPV